MGSCFVSGFRWECSRGDWKGLLGLWFKLADSKWYSYLLGPCSYGDITALDCFSAEQGNCASHSLRLTLNCVCVCACAYHIHLLLRGKRLFMACFMQPLALFQAITCLSYSTVHSAEFPSKSTYIKLIVKDCKSKRHTLFTLFKVLAMCKLFIFDKWD
jgi:hypothetical protein